MPRSEVISDASRLDACLAAALARAHGQGYRGGSAL